ncbi:MAG: hypothetical protein EAZ69_06120 [Oscillatoriales cyanobacterium]|nr:MAG: hypothetical protein EAZ69_06120 [Oscillatoriales cyanobacterium]
MPLINLQPSGALRPELATDAEVAQAIAAHKAKVDEMISQSLIRTLSVMSRTGAACSVRSMPCTTPYWWENT